MEGYELLQMQSLPLEQKIIKTNQRIREFCDHFNNEVYVSFSGGKDSTVLYDLVKQIYPTCPAVFCNTGLEYPEIVEFCKETKGVRFIKPKVPFTKVIERFGYPIISKEQAGFIRAYRATKSEKMKNLLMNGNRWGKGKIVNKYKYLIDAPFKISDQCCEVMKKRPFHIFQHRTGKHPILGTMASESSLRTVNYLKNGCNTFDGENPSSTPLGFWTEQDVLQYIVEHRVPYCKIYGDIVLENGKYKTTGVDRTGCMFCCFGVQFEDSPNRFEKMKITHPQIYDYCINKLNLKEVLDYIKVKY